MDLTADAATENDEARRKAAIAGYLDQDPAAARSWRAHQWMCQAASPEQINAAVNVASALLLEAKNDPEWLATRLEEHNHARAIVGMPAASTAPMLAKIASGTRHTLLPLLGFSHGGVPGAAVAVGIDKALSSFANAKAARNAAKLFYGAQPRRAVDPRFARAGGLAGQVIGGSGTGDRATAQPAPLALSPPPIRRMTPGARR